MKIDFLKSWSGAIVINGTTFNSYSDIPSAVVVDNTTTILLQPKTNAEPVRRIEASAPIYKVTVKQYMLNAGTPEFDFMTKWNNDVPMPLRTMVGTIEKETRGMYKMNLQADTTFEVLDCCMKCGRTITNPVSKYFGMGPECGGHNYTNPFASDEELHAEIAKYKQEFLAKIKWNGWVIKSAITSMEQVC